MKFCALYPPICRYTCYSGVCSDSKYVEEGLQVRVESLLDVFPLLQADESLSGFIIHGDD